MVALDISKAQPVAHAVLPVLPGCYVLVAGPEAMRDLGLSAGSCPAALYVGEAVRGVRTRMTDHLDACRTGKSSPRRSIGALLRETLELGPQPRSQNPNDSKRFINYKFDDGSERRLSDWIAANLHVCGIASSDSAKTESELIHQLHPPLNLTKLGGWRNPSKEMIRRKRQDCAELARMAAADGRALR